MFTVSISWNINIEGNKEKCYGRSKALLQKGKHEKAEKCS